MACQGVATTEKAEALPPARPRVGGSLYAYRVRGRDRGAVVLWIGGRGDEPDQVYATTEAGRRHVPVFVTVRQARVHVRRQGWRLAAPEVGTVELARVQHWLEDPVRRKVPPAAVLDTWNFVDDLARGLDAGHRLPRQGAVHHRAYEKLFGGAAVAWTAGEERAVLELLTAGVELWNACPVSARPGR